MSAPLIYVDVRQSKSRWPLIRPQRWYWVALNGNNFHTLARSSEMYTSRYDCLDAVAQLFGTTSNVYLRQHEKGNAALRMAAETS